MTVNELEKAANAALALIPLGAKVLFFVILCYLVWNALTTRLKGWTRTDLLIALAALSVAGFGLK